jgi:tetratricopeptide (TPR) repeat protein
MALHQQGKFADAERIYREILQNQPQHLGALFRLGVIALQTRHPERAVELIGKVIALEPDNTEAYYNRGLALQDLKRPKDALASYDRAIALKPNFATAYNSRGNALLNLKRPAEALASFDRAIALMPEYAEAHYNRGRALLDLKRPEDALASFDRAIALKPDLAGAHSNRGNVLLDLKRPAEALASYDKAIALKLDLAGAHYNRGNVLLDLKRPAEALASYDMAIALKPDYAEAHNNRSNALRDLKRPEDALASCDKAIALKPDFAEAYNNRGLALDNLNRPEEALASYDRAIALKPDFAGAHSNRGNPLRDLKRPEDALASCDKAIALKPDFAEAYNNRGLALLDLNCPEDALASYDKAIALRPDLAGAYFNKSCCLLLLGRFQQGWRLHEWRKKLEGLKATRSFPKPLWLGKENIAGKTLFIWWEQGFGDTIQFCRYAKLVEARGAKVVISVQKPLHGLLKQISPTIEIINQDDVPHNFDYNCPLLSLPLAFGTTLETIPANIPYLKADVEKSLFWREKLGEKNKPRVGLVWSGGFRPNQPEVWSVNSRRNIPLAKLAALKNPYIEFYSLQKGQPAESELTKLRRNNWGGPDIIDFTSELNDFSDTAALIDNLDLVISVDTSTAHLAGAMGKPVWILNRFDSCWRWLLDRNDSPWYPSAKLFRQQQIGNWAGVIDQVKDELRSVTG